jgi:hypothetical protein
MPAAGLQALTLPPTGPTQAPRTYYRLALLGPRLPTAGCLLAGSLDFLDFGLRIALNPPMAWV